MTVEQTMFPKPYADAVAKLRVPSGFILLIGFTLLARPTLESLSWGLPVSVFGLLLRGWAAGHLAKNQELATGGPYAYIRNPLYAGTLIVAAGIVVASRDWLLAFIFAVVFLLVYLPVIELEEQHLRKLFPDYDSYAAHVWRLLPVRRWPASRRRFSFGLYRKNEEWKALAGLLTATAWLLFRAMNRG